MFSMTSDQALSRHNRGTGMMRSLYTTTRQAKMSHAWLEWQKVVPMAHRWQGQAVDIGAPKHVDSIEGDTAALWIVFVNWGQHVQFLDWTHDAQLGCCQVWPQSATFIVM